ncbi:ectoine synthase [Dysosmobacter sp. NSJ-60]|nr:ectoine synthase [Dysosmobacter hominis]
MIIRQENSLPESQYAKTDHWESFRIFVKKDQLGCSFHKCINKANTEHVLWYKNHKEIVVIVDGLAEVVNLSTGETHSLGPGSAYALTGDRHIFRAITEVTSYCVFLPGLNGDEVPDEDGVYPANE